MRTDVSRSLTNSPQFAGVSAGSNADVWSLPLAEVAIASILAAGLWALQTRSWRATELADFVAEVFCPSECVRLIQDQASMRNVDSRIHSLRFDCCVFLFYSFSAVTFATKSAKRFTSQCKKNSNLSREMTLRSA